MAACAINFTPALESNEALDLSCKSGSSSTAPIAGPSQGYKMSAIRSKRRNSGCSEWSKIKRKLKTPAFFASVEEQPLDLSMKTMNSQNNGRQTIIYMSDSDGRNSDDMVDDHFKRVLGAGKFNKIFKPDEKEEAEKLVVEHFMKSLQRPVKFSL